MRNSGSPSPVCRRLITSLGRTTPQRVPELADFKFDHGIPLACYCTSVITCWAFLATWVAVFANPSAAHFRSEQDIKYFLCMRNGRHVVFMNLCSPKMICTDIIMCIPYVCTFVMGCRMGTARVFRSGNSQAVRLPKQFRLKGKEVEIFRRGDEIVLRGRMAPWRERSICWRVCRTTPNRWGREKDQPQKRKGL